MTQVPTQCDVLVIGGGCREHGLYLAGPQRAFGCHAGKRTSPALSYRRVSAPL